MKIVKRIHFLFGNEKGATMAEYAIIAAFVVAIAILAFSGLGRIIVQHILNLVSEVAAYGS